MTPDILQLGDVGHDVVVLQQRLNQHGAKLDLDHIFGPQTEAAVRRFQRAANLLPDGVVGPITHAALQGQTPAHHLTYIAIEDAADRLDCPVPAILAVMQVETRGTGYLADGRCKILYERHLMYRLLKAAGTDPRPWAKRWPNIVNPSPGGYLGGGAEYGRLAHAKTIDVACAIQSCSWGRFQILGEHWDALDYDSPDAFAAAMQASPENQLDAFCRFVAADKPMHKALREQDWTTFARGYNGPAYAEHHYAERLATAFVQHGGKPPAKPRRKASTKPTTPAQDNPS